MNYKILFKSLKFAFLPTFSVLMLLFFAFFSISKTLAFIGSNNWIAILLRVILFVAEVGLVCYMYNQYIEEENLNAAISLKEGDLKKEARSFDAESDLSRIFGDPSYRNQDRFQVYKTIGEDSNLRIVKRVTNKILN